MKPNNFMKTMDHNTFEKYNKDLFKKVAPHYKWLDLMARNFRKDYSKFLGDIEGLQVLDVATGSGQQAIKFKEGGAVVTGIDLSTDMLMLAKNDAKAEGIEFLSGNSTQLPFESNSFDLCSMSFALHCMPEDIRRQTVSEMKRVVRPGGIVAFNDYHKPQNGIGKIIHGTVSLFETQLFKAFFKTDFEKLLLSLGLTIHKKSQTFMGNVQMIMCKTEA